MTLKTAQGKNTSATKGLHHWWIHRVTAVALIPLTFWFTYAVIDIAGADYKAVIEELSAPFNAVLIISLIVVSFYHAALGMQVVFEDYVSTIKTRNICIISSNLILFLLALAGVFAVLSIAFGDK